jgi:uncharacterized protein YndB with AHSA1/START domain
VTYDFTIERVFDAPPELVFDAYVDPDGQHELFSGVLEGWDLLESEIDLRVGGTWTIVVGPVDGSSEPDRITNVFTEIDRPHRLSYQATMYVGEWGRTVSYSETMTFEERDGKTLLTITESGFSTEEDRDAFESGTPEFLEALERAVASRKSAGGAA